MLSGTSTDSRKLSCSRATALEQEKTSSQSLCQKAYFPVYDSNSYSSVHPRVDFHVFTRFLSYRITIVELDVNSCATFSAIIEIISALSHADC